MSISKRDRIIYWVLTLLVLLPTAGSAVPELFSSGPRATVESYRLLGYPFYLMKILGVFKILGAVAIVLDRNRRVVEWAYAGFGVLFVGATASHVLAGDSSHAPIPLVFFAILVGSYALSIRLETLSQSSAEGN